MGQVVLRAKTPAHRHVLAANTPARPRGSPLHHAQRSTALHRALPDATKVQGSWHQYRTFPCGLPSRSSCVACPPPFQGGKNTAAAAQKAATAAHLTRTLGATIAQKSHECKLPGCRRPAAIKPSLGRAPYIRHHCALLSCRLECTPQFLPPALHLYFMAPQMCA